MRKILVFEKEKDSQVSEILITLPIENRNYFQAEKLIRYSNTTVMNPITKQPQNVAITKTYMVFDHNFEENETNLYDKLAKLSYRIFVTVEAFLVWKSTV